MKKIIGLAIAGVLLLALVAGGTLAFFQDTETATGNAITSGTLNLSVGTADPMTDTITIIDVKPGTAQGNAANWELQNTGNLPGNFYLVVGTTTENENSIIEPEEEAGDITAEAGELGSKISIALWFDAGVAGTWDDGDYYFMNDETIVAWQSGDSGLPAAAWGSPASFSGDDWSAASGQPAMAASFNKFFKVVYKWTDSGDATDSVAMGDDCTFDITFYLKQQ